jgi:hypothetical protein
MPLSTLPTLGALPSLGPLATQAITGQTAEGTPSSSVSGGGAATTDAGTTPGVLASAGKFITFLMSGNFVLIVIGLLLVAAGIFSFDKTRELVVSGTKAVKSVGKAATSAASLA